jgi:pyruvate dehydrogenase E2 component (dihydrolipoamide acetyltransferase)
MAKEYDIDLAEVPATGTRGRVSKGDILKFLEGGDSGTKGAPDRSAVGREEVLGSARRTIARRLTESKRNAPHYRLTADICIDKLLDLRRDIEEGDPESHVSVNDMLVCAAAQALTEHEDVNIQFDGEKISRFAHADIAVAVAADTGLVTPIVRAADTKGLSSLARELRELVDRARKGRLLPDDLAGGTFTLSNLGMFGVKSFDAIINPPQAAIMAVGAAGRRLYVGEDDEPGVGIFITVTLSCDHRVIDGASGAAFLRTFAETLERPGRLLL